MRPNPQVSGRTLRSSPSTSPDWDMKFMSLQLHPIFHNGEYGTHIDVRHGVPNSSTTYPSIEHTLTFRAHPGGSFNG